MSRAKPQGGSITLTVRHRDGVVKQIRHWTAKAARLEAKRLAGLANIVAIHITDRVTGDSAQLWEA